MNKDIKDDTYYKNDKKYIKMGKRLNMGIFIVIILIIIAMFFLIGFGIKCWECMWNRYVIINPTGNRFINFS